MHACVLVGGPERVIEVKGKPYPFEDHPQLGPVPLNARGQERTIGPRHAFWTAVTAWYQQGKQLGPDGRCAWSPMPPEVEERPDGIVVVHGIECVRVGRRMLVQRSVAERLLPAGRPADKMVASGTSPAHPRGPEANVAETPAPAQEVRTLRGPRRDDRRGPRLP